MCGSGVGRCVCWGQRPRAIWQIERSPPDPPTSREGIQDWLPLVPQSCQGKGEGGGADKRQRQVGLDSALHSVLTRAQLDRLGDSGKETEATPIPYLGCPCLRVVTASQ